MELFSFEEVRDRVNNFIENIKKKGEWDIIIYEMLTAEFRNYYTPNIPYDKEQPYQSQDCKIYIKNGTFEIELHQHSSIVYLVVNVFQIDGTTSPDQIDQISMREWLYVYSNPEGIQLLEKVEFIIENTDWEQLEEDRRQRLGQGMRQEDYDYNDEIPF